MRFFCVTHGAVASQEDPAHFLNRQHRSDLFLPSICGGRDSQICFSALRRNGSAGHGNSSPFLNPMRHNEFCPSTGRGRPDDFFTPFHHGAYRDLNFLFRLAIAPRTERLLLYTPSLRKGRALEIFGRTPRGGARAVRRRTKMKSH